MKDKVAIITGSSGALGSRLAIDLANEGAKVVVCYFSHPKNGEKVLEKIHSQNGEAILTHLDVSDPLSIKKMVSACLESFGSIDILINCAGISRNGISWHVLDQDWNSVIATNLTGTFLCCREVIPSMKKKKWGRIINFTSIVGQIGVPGTSAYSASKAGIFGLTGCLASETAIYNITVNSISLGYFNGGIINEVPADKLKTVISSIPINRLGEIHEMIGVVKFLCGESAAYITGQTININGGMYA